MVVVTILCSHRRQGRTHFGVHYTTLSYSGILDIETRYTVCASKQKSGFGNFDHCILYVLSNTNNPCSVIGDRYVPQPR